MGVTKEPVYIIIPVHNRKAITLQCLETLKTNGDLDRYYTIVIDDGSTDGTSDAIKSLYPDIIILTGNGNLWWTGAIKMGMKYAYEQGAEYFIWLNDDCLVNENTFKRLVSFCQDNLDSIVGCQGQEENNPNKISFGGKIKNNLNYKIIDCPQGSIQPCDMLSGNLVCMPRLIVDRINYPPSELVPHYGGDTLFLIRAKKAGFKIFVDNIDDTIDIPAESKVSPQRWLFAEGHAFSILKLLFNPYSLYSWKIWLNLHQAEYGFFLGTLSFIFDYGSKIFLPIAFISFLRIFPLSIRYQLSYFKRKINSA